MGSHRHHPTAFGIFWRNLFNGEQHYWKIVKPRFIKNLCKWSSPCLSFSFSLNEEKTAPAHRHWCAVISFQFERNQASQRCLGAVPCMPRLVPASPQMWFPALIFFLRENWRDGDQGENAFKSHLSSKGKQQLHRLNSFSGSEWGEKREKKDPDVATAWQSPGLQSILRNQAKGICRQKILKSAFLSSFSIFEDYFSLILQREAQLESHFHQYFVATQNGCLANRSHPVLPAWSQGSWKQSRHWITPEVVITPEARWMMRPADRGDGCAASCPDHICPRAC